MALFTSKLEVINKLILRDIQGKIEQDLYKRLHEIVDAELQQIATKAAKDLLVQIETFNDLDGTVQLRVNFSKGKSHEQTD